MANLLTLDRPLGGVLRDVRQGLYGLCLVGSLVFGSQHAGWWLLLPPIAFAVCLGIESHSIRQKVGRAAWASEGFARFTFGTGMGHLCRDTLACAALFLLVHTLFDLLAL